MLYGCSAGFARTNLESTSAARFSDEAEGAEVDRDRWEKLLAFLEATHPRCAGTAYEALRGKLVRFFRFKGSTQPEELADVTFDRMARKLVNEPDIQIPNPTNYMMGVARLVWLETIKRESSQRIKLNNYNATGDEDDSHAREQEQNMAILERVLAELDPEERDLLLRYYRGLGQDRIQGRQSMLREMGIKSGLLRARIHRLRLRLEKRVEQILSADGELAA
jgi:DNA-directed RNA polymerase specialized sigma24 family protein